MTQHHESAFETEICEYLAANGWLYSPTDDGYDAELAMFPDDVFDWLAATQPEQLAKRVKPDLTGEALIKARAGVLSTLVKQLGADPKANGGTLSVLRRGFKDLNAQFAMCQFRPPNTTLNETTKTRFDAVRLRVMRQVHYSTQKLEQHRLGVLRQRYPGRDSGVEDRPQRSERPRCCAAVQASPAAQGRAVVAVRFSGGGALCGVKLRGSDDHEVGG